MAVAATRISPQGFECVGWQSDAAWEWRLERDRERAARNQTATQRSITAELYERATAQGAEALALTGSTARDKRTAISDLDYHLVGTRPRYEDLRDDVDIYATDAQRFWVKLRGGDDYVQWTLRYGCILFDRTGVFREAMRIVATEGLWPDTTRKRARLPAHREHARRLIALGDRDAAQEQVRAGITAAARATLLDAGVFPLARRELPAQLRQIRSHRLAGALDATIREPRTLDELRFDLASIDDAIAR